MVKEETLVRDDVNMSLLEGRQKRFKDLTGNVYGNLTILGPYKQERELKWVAECGCGNIVKTSRNKIYNRGKRSCVECSEQKLKDQTYIPLEEKRSNLVTTRKDLLIGKALGATTNDLWEVTCVNCNDPYVGSYGNLVRGMISCNCSGNKRKALDEKMNFISTFCLNRTLIFLGWLSNTSHISCTMYCPRHTKTWIALYGNLESGKGCSTCGTESAARKRSLSTVEFIEKATAIHGELYDYSLVNYTNGDTHVPIICTRCGITNQQRPVRHLAGNGCKSCASYGYDPESPCYTYIMELYSPLLGTYNKVGITNSIPKRLSNLRKDSSFEINPIRTLYFDKGYKAKSLEVASLSAVDERRVLSKLVQPDGYTETFRTEQLPIVESLFDDIKYKYTLVTEHDWYT